MHKQLVRAQYTPTDEQFIDILLLLPEQQQHQEYITASHLPTLKITKTKITKCQSPKCVTCLHLNTTPHFTSSVTKITYPIRHTFSCSSKNVIYLITCTKCRKQYVRLPTKFLRERINHHRTSINTKNKRYINNHFNFPDHSLNNLSVQAIDTVKNSTFQKPNDLELLRTLLDTHIKYIQTMRVK